MPNKKRGSKAAGRNKDKNQKAGVSDFNEQLAGAQEDRAAELMRDPSIVTRTLAASNREMADQLGRLTEVISSLLAALKEQAKKVTAEGRSENKTQDQIDLDIVNMNVGTACFEIEVVRKHLVDIIQLRDQALSEAILDTWTVLGAIMSVYKETNAMGAMACQSPPKKPAVEDVLPLGDVLARVSRLEAAMAACTAASCSMDQGACSSTRGRSIT